MELPDDIIRNDFEKLFDDIHNWVRDNSIGMRHKDDIDEIFQILKAEPFFRTLDKPCSDFEVDLNHSTAADSLLNAALVHKICHYFFENIFWPSPLLYYLSGKHEAQVDASRSLGKIMDMQCEDGNSIVPIVEWRAATLAMLTANPKYPKLLESYCKLLLDDFSEDFKLLLQHTVHYDEWERLYSILVEFATFSIKLLKQKWQITVHGLEYPENQKFQSASNTMVKSRAVLLDPGDDSLDGRPTPLVIQPLILAHGDCNQHATLPIQKLK